VRKEDIIHIHTLLAQLRRRDEVLGLAEPGAFDEYDAFGVLPTHIHRTKGTHARALFLLATGIHKGTGFKTKVHDPFAPLERERL
jgi:hypothetical protein